MTIAGRLGVLGGRWRLLTILRGCLGMDAEISPALRLFGSPGKRGEPPPAITTLDDWFERAPPKGGAEHWVPLRSAYELAPVWCGGADTGVAPPVLSL
jgi:hypothetical protein